MISATNLYTQARNLVAPAAASAPGPTTRIAAGIDAFSQVMAAADQTATAAMAGKSDTQSLVQAVSEAQLALDTAVTIRDKVVEAYQEILRMPI
ncbi:flagellar hook-basal body complex protein FliE [Paracoccus pacificus]|uniref:Flagellar hook-basal body complex protein FliE n=1 Tax=Paracoccus pacificus TaxID=1463598 RepID=A0ABW4R967_9RHOB